MDVVFFVVQSITQKRILLCFSLNLALWIGNREYTTFSLDQIDNISIFIEFTQNEKINTGESKVKELSDEQIRLQKTNQSLQVCITLCLAQPSNTIDKSSKNELSSVRTINNQYQVPAVRIKGKNGVCAIAV